MAEEGLAAWSLVTPSTMSPTVLMVPRASSGMSMLKASSTSKEMLILSRESMLSSSKVLARVTVSGGIPFDLAMMSMQRLATWFMMFQLPCWELASTYRDARADVKVAAWTRISLEDAEEAARAIRRLPQRLKPRCA